MLSPRHILLTCAALWGGANSALALDTDACFQTTTQIGDVTAAFVDSGWQTADRSDPLIIDHITWMGMPQYFAGDSGGQMLGSILDMKRMSAVGILKKQDLANAKTRILSRKVNGKTEVAKIAVVSLTQQHASVHCTFSLASDSVAAWPESGLKVATGPQFQRLNSTAPTVKNAQASKDVVALNAAALSKALPTPPPSDAIVETYLSFLTKEN